MLEQMERHALCRLRTDTGERPEPCDETIEARQRFLRRTRRSFAIVHRQGEAGFRDATATPKRLRREA